MLKTLMITVSLTFSIVAPSIAHAALACDDATFARAHSALSSMSTKKQSKFSMKLDKAKKAKEAGNTEKCSKLLSAIIGKAR